jgi:hypothetical protein
VLKESKPTVNVVFAFCLGVPNGPNSSAESFGCARLQLQHFFFSVLWLRASFEPMEKASQDKSNFVDGGLE